MMSSTPHCDNCGEYPGHAVTDEIERLRAELQVIATTPAGPSGRSGNEMYFQRRAEAALAMNPKEARE